MADELSQVVLALVRDLMFSSKIVAEGRAQGVPIQVIRQVELLTQAPAGRLLLVDLALEEAIDAASAWQGQTGGKAIGFVSHVDSQTIQRAQQAGIGQVMTRSQFTRLLPELLAGR